MKVFFAPDYREGVAYQALLAGALAELGIEVAFPRGNRRVLPLSRGLEGWSGDLLHLHWPEKYFVTQRDGLDFWRRARYPLDLALAAGRAPVVLTAHDLLPHNRADETLVRRNFQRTYDVARAVIVHSEKAGEAVRAAYGVEKGKVHVVPHGDLSTGGSSSSLSVSSSPLPSRAESRGALGIAPEERVCLVFGTVEPYKGIEPVLDWWRAAAPAGTLAIAGRPFTAEYAAAIRERSGGLGNIRLDLAWQSDEALGRWLTAADCALFHYKAVFTSGAACLARSLGIPILIPRRLDTIDLDEPHPLVFRFDALDTDFRPALQAALTAHPDFAAAEPWRQTTAWARIAEATARVYRAVA
jgi:glycosyltransferase involved in cell wall biosynthesis